MLQVNTECANVLDALGITAHRGEKLLTLMNEINTNVIDDGYNFGRTVELITDYTNNQNELAFCLMALGAFNHELSGYFFINNTKQTT